MASIASVPPWQQAILAANRVAFAALFVRILYIRATKAYPALTVWLAANLVEAIVVWLYPLDDHQYRWFYVVAESTSLLLFASMVLELYARILKSLPGIASTARVVIWLVLPAIAASTIVPMSFEVKPRGPVTVVYIAGQALITALALFIFIISAFMMWFPVRLARNTVVYLAGFAVYLVPSGASMFLAYSQHVVWWLGPVADMVMCTLCLLFWSVALTPAGMTSCVSPARIFHAGDEDRLLAQLESINRALSRGREK